MYVTVIPFLLAAHVTIPDDRTQREPDWLTYGPEWTYDVLVNLSVAYQFHDDSHSCVTMTAEMKCRPLDNNMLSCHFANSRMSKDKWSKELQDCPVPSNFEPTDPAIMNGETFRIKFNRRGIENLEVPRNITRTGLDVLRDVVSQLHIGFAPEEVHSSVAAMEKSSIGYCKMEAVVTRDPYPKYNIPKVYPFEIVYEPLQPEVEPLHSTVWRIEKVRQMKRCPDNNIHFFEFNDNPDFGNKNRLVDITSSKSSIVVTKMGLHGETESIGTMKALMKPKTLQVRQKISVTLREIMGAKTEIRNISNPVTTDLYGFRGVDL
ncbi:uncharacterized protein LOC144473007 [Augochlora pura]